MAIAVEPEPTGITTSRPTFIWRSPEELREIATSEPDNPIPLYLLAAVLRRAGESRWRAIVNEALERPHTAPQRVYARSMMRITFGDWGGWTDYDMRLQNPDTIRDLFFFSEICWRGQPWDGQEDLAGKSLLILPEQGMGDCLQMWRFVPALVESTHRPTLMLYPRLVPLARHNFGARAQISLCLKRPTVWYDRYVWCMSLPRLFGGLPPFQPLAGPGRRPRLAPRAGPLRVGICWAGNAEYLHDADRSIPFDALTPLLSRSDVEWYSLQVGPRAAEGIGHPSLRMPNPPLLTFSDTADLMGQLDCVVVVDTSAAHLAGLLGVPTYLVLQHDSNWRWGLDDMTPWYPSMRLIRQTAFGDWSSAVRLVGAALDEGMHASLDHRAELASV